MSAFTSSRLTPLAAVLAFSALGALASAAPLNIHQQLARDLFQELIEIDTTDSVGSVTRAAEAMAARLRAAGIPSEDIAVVGPNDRKKNLVVRLHGTGPKRPILFIGHLDVVEAPRVDWATDPFQFVEKDGYFYGRGTLDMKGSDAILVATLIRLWKEGFKPRRDIIVALTAGEESFKDNGVKWLTENRRDLIDAEFVINSDGGGVMTERGKPVSLMVDAAEKLYGDFKLTVINPGGPSALPEADNAIYRLARALRQLEQHRFAFELNPVTRAYFAQLVKTTEPERAAQIRALLKNPPEADAVERSAHDKFDNAMLHTICVATRLEGGHANNALPQEANAMVNCRILPGHSAEEVRQELRAAINDPQVQIRFVRESDGQIFDVAPDAVAMPAAAPRPEVMVPLENVAKRFFPGVPIIPAMSVGESDAVWATAAGIPTYALSGLAVDRDDVRAHGKDERLGVDSFYKGLEFFYEYTKALTSYR
jgi:acetylornithine deacetylase/succinyl-diaminopimelate desuccinylase-like protein